jgi:hypothetical protein
MKRLQFVWPAALAANGFLLASRAQATVIDFDALAETANGIQRKRMKELISLLALRASDCGKRRLCSLKAELQHIYAALRCGRSRPRSRAASVMAWATTWCMS